MISNSDLFLPIPVSHNISTSVLETATPETDNASQPIDSERLFRSILHVQSQEKSKQTVQNLISLLTAGNIAEAEDVALINSEGTAISAGEPTNNLPDSVTIVKAAISTGNIVDVNPAEQIEVATAVPFLNPGFLNMAELESQVTTWQVDSASKNIFATASLATGATATSASVNSSSTNPPNGISPMGSSSYASSLANLSEEVMQSSRQAVDVDMVSATESGQSQWSGKLIPPGGKNLPGNLLFLTNPGETWFQMGINSDLINKANYQNLQQIQPSEPQFTLQQTIQSEAPSTALNMSSLSSIEKIISGGNSAALNSASTSSFTIESLAGSSDWSNQVGDKIRWMGRVNISSAELRLHPAELGTVEIRISTEDEQTKVSFVTNNAVTKEIIEASLPRLRDLLASSGLQLEQSDVSQKNLSDNRTSQKETNIKDTASEEQNAVNGDASQLIRQHSLSQFDHYV